MADLSLHAALPAAVQALCTCFAGGGKLLLCGNGGSAADCAHISGELIKGFLKRRPLPDALLAALPQAGILQGGLPAVDLTANTAVMTAIVNDIGGQALFAQQVLALGRPGDVLLGISTSGRAPDVLLALQVARAMGLVTLGLTGRGGGAMAGACDILLDVAATDTAQVQQLHMPVYHALCAAVEEHFFAR